MAPSTSIASTLIPPTAPTFKSVGCSVSPSNLVIGTNDSSIVSKRSAEKKNYFTQPQHLRHFVSKPRRRAPLINLGYSIRTILVDLIIRRFLDTHLQPDQSSLQTSGSPIVIVNLGCGYDPGFFKLASLSSEDLKLNRRLRYVDADYPELVKKKRALINQSAELSAILPDFSLNTTSFVSTPDQRLSYALLGCDLCDVSSFISALINLLGDSSQNAILFISEVSTVYMPSEKSDALLSGISVPFPRAVYACLEQVLYPSPTAFSNTMLGHFRKLQTPLRGTMKYPTVRDQTIRLKRLWSTVEISTLLDLWNRMDDGIKTAQEKTRLLQVEEFDEWEELDLFLSHYLVAIAYPHVELMAPTYKDLTKINLPPLTTMTEISSSEAERVELRPARSPWHMITSDITIQRRGHTTIALSDGSHFVFGGYGLSSTASPHTNLTHSRLSHPMLLVPTRKDPFKFTIETLPLTSSTPCARMYHVALYHQVHNNELVMVFGGRTSPRSPLNDVHVFNIQSRAWSTVNPDSSTPWPEARYRHAAVSLKTKDHHQLCLIHGGIGKDGNILSDTWLFDVIALKWTRAHLLDDTIGSRHSHQMWYDAERCNLLVLGGITKKVAEQGTSRIGRNIKIELILTEDGHLTVTPRAFEFSTSNPFLSRYSHQILPWNSEKSLLLVSGGLSHSGIIAPENQCLLINTNDGSVRSFDLSTCEPRCLVDHTVSLVRRCPRALDGAKVVMVLGGGATCFSFGTQFDIHPLLLSDSAFPAAPLDYDEYDRMTTGRNLKAGTHTFAPDREDTWNKVQPLPRIEGPSDAEWHHCLTRSEPTVFIKLDLGDCLTRWTPTYLKERCGELKCSVHVSDQSTNLTWHNKNFKYTMMSFGELIERAFDKSPDSSETIYLRSLSTSPRQPSDFSKDFPKLVQDFVIPDPIRAVVMNQFFSSVLRISGADMGLWAHYDTCDNVLAQIQGRKLVRMWHPSEAPNLYLEGSSSHIPNFETPDLDRFPLYRKSHPMITILEPGDVLFIPATWLHSVQSLSPSISINIFFKTQSSNMYSPHDIWGNVDPLPVQAVGQEVMDSVKQLDVLPLAQRQLYLKKLGMSLIRLADQQM